MTTTVTTTATTKAPKAPKSTVKRTETHLEGTVADLINNDRLRINGSVVGQPEMSVLARLGIAKEVGTAVRPDGRRGPSPKILAIPLTFPGMKVVRR